FITYDEGGGFWDSLPPKVVDDYGFGTRIPAMLISPWARSGLVDHHLASTASILKFIETRFGLDPLNHRDRDAYDLLGAFDWDQQPKDFSV
ncbi:phospholipase, partial [Acidithiobacillus thiooxidans]